MTSDASPRSRNSHVVSRLRMASSSRESSASCRPSAPRRLGGVGPRLPELGVRGARLGRHRGAIRGRGGGEVGLGAVREPAGSLERREVLVEVVPAGQLVEVGLAIAVADPAQRVAA